MPTNTQGNQSRDYNKQLVHYFRKTINFNDAGIAAGTSFADMLPAGAQIIDTIVNVLTAFNAGTTNVITVGYNSSTFNNVVASGDVTAGSVGGTRVVRPLSLAPNASAQQLFATYTQTGSAASAGQAEIVVTFVQNNDQ